MKRKTFLTITTSVFTLLLICALDSASTQAATVNLQTDLIDLGAAGSITSGDTRYFLFRDDPPFADLSTWEVSDVPGTNGIEFNYNPALGANPLDNTGGVGPLELTLKFEVESLNHPFGDGLFFGTNKLELTDFSGSVSIEEIVFDDISIPHDSIGSKLVDENSLMDMTSFVDNPATDLFTVHIHKIITVQAGSEIRGFSQEFTGNQIPEPSTIALFGLGIVGTLVHRRRRRK